jgi:hypothetical protein
MFTVAVFIGARARQTWKKRPVSASRVARFQFSFSTAAVKIGGIAMRNETASRKARGS